MERETNEWADWMTLPPHWKPWPVPNPEMPEPSPGRITAERKLRQTVTLTFVGMGLMMGATLLYYWVESRGLAKAQGQVAARATQADSTPRPAAQAGASARVHVPEQQYTLADLMEALDKRGASRIPLSEEQLEAYTCEVPMPGFFYRVREDDELLGEAGIAAQVLSRAVLDEAQAQGLPPRKAQTRAQALAGSVRTQKLYAALVVESRWNAAGVRPGARLWLPRVRWGVLLDRGRRQRAATTQAEQRLRAPPAVTVTTQVDTQIAPTFADTMALSEAELFADEETRHGTAVSVTDGMVVAIGEDSPTPGASIGTAGMHFSTA